MDLNAARQAQAILPQLDAITELHDSIVVAETQAWRLVEMTVEASVGGVSAISSVSTTAANTNSWAGVIDAVNSLKAEVVILKAALKDAVDNNTKAIAIAHTEENENLEEIADELKAIHSSNGNLALAGPA